MHTAHCKREKENSFWSAVAQTPIAYRTRRVSPLTSVLVFRSCSRCFRGTSRLSLPQDITNFIQGSGHGAQYVPLPTSATTLTTASDATSASTDDTDDVPMLQMEDVNDHEGGWPIYLGMLNRKDRLFVVVARCRLLVFRAKSF